MREIARDVWIGMSLSEELKIVRLDPPQDQSLGFKLVGIAGKRHGTKVGPKELLSLESSAFRQWLSAEPSDTTDSCSDMHAPHGIELQDTRGCRPASFRRHTRNCSPATRRDRSASGRETFLVRVGNESQQEGR